MASSDAAGEYAKLGSTTDTEGETDTNHAAEGVESAASYGKHEFAAHQRPEAFAPSAPDADPSAPPRPPDPQPSPIRVEMMSGPPLVVDSTGRLLVQNRPGWLMRCFMCPFPFFCAGCCMSESSDLAFDDGAQTITIRRWPGYCWCGCEKETVVVQYRDIANVVAVPGNMQINQRQAYNLTLVLVTGERLRISDPDLESNHAPRLLAYHRFLFGRANPQAYQPPEVETLFLF